MKKLLFSAAILAAFASCSKNEVTDMSQVDALREISFSSLNDRVVSKIANDNGSDFRVFAYKGSPTAVLYFADYVKSTSTIEGTAEGPVDGPHHWPTDNSAMAFYAYAPYSTSGGNVTENATTPTTLSYVVPETAQEDFTVAEAVSVTANDYPDFVALKFNHMLSKITVNVVLEGSTTNPATGFAKNHHIADGSETNAVAGDAPFTATFSALKNAFTVDATGQVDPAAATANTGTSMAYATAQSYYIAPQDFAGCKLQIKGITIRDNETNSEMFKGDLEEITLDGTELNATGAAFEAGKHYVFTITVDSEAAGMVEIKFTATSDATWDADNDVAVDQTASNS